MTTSTPVAAPMFAYHNDAALRDATIAQMRTHAAADDLVPGYGYWQDGKGCAVGCLTHDPQGGHDTYPARWGIPRVLADLEDRLFEALPVDLAKAWPVRFLSAIPLGADLSLAWPRFALAILTDATHGCARHCNAGSAQALAVEGVSVLLRRQIAGGVVASEEWQTSRRATYAADSDAYAYAPDAAVYAAVDVAADDVDAAAYAADSDAYAAKDAAARTAHRVWQADTLITILASCPVPA